MQTSSRADPIISRSWGRSQSPGSVSRVLGLKAGVTSAVEPPNVAGTGYTAADSRPSKMSPGGDMLQSMRKICPSERTTWGTETRTPSSWMCSRARQSKLALPR